MYNKADRGGRGGVSPQSQMKNFFSNLFDGLPRHFVRYCEKIIKVLIGSDNLAQCLNDKPFVFLIYVCVSTQTTLVFPCLTVYRAVRFGRARAIRPAFAAAQSRPTE